MLKIDKEDKLKKLENENIALMEEKLKIEKRILSNLIQMQRLEIH